MKGNGVHEQKGQALDLGPYWLVVPLLEGAVIPALLHAG
jgi:hypothetical protein